MKKIAILGSTGSIGVNALKVISRYRDKFNVAALTGRSNFKLLARQALEFKPRLLGIADTSKVNGLKTALGGADIPILCGPEGIEEIAGGCNADIVLIAISGNASLIPLVKAIESGRRIALASKEPLVSAGGIIMGLAKERNVRILPVDSEHSAVFQCLNGRPLKELKKIYITGSGGPLSSVKKRLFDTLPRTRILSHPKWKMGKKITVDSATLMNKGLEAIEARWLFGLALERIEVLMHPEAICHSLIEFVDGTLLAQMAMPDMRLPIQYALNFPDRLESDNFNVDFSRIKRLSFSRPDEKKFPCLSLAYEASRKGGTYPAALNGSNEEAVEMYLARKIDFTAIPRVIERVLSLHRPIDKPSLVNVLEVDTWAREEARRGLR